MAQPVQLQFRETDAELPDTYTLPPDMALEMAAVKARINGAGASGTFIPCLAILSQDGKLMARVRIDQEFAVGDTGDLTWAPFLRRAAAAATAGGAAEFAYCEDTTLTPGAGPTAPAFNDFERTSATVFNTSATDGGAISNASGNSYLRCELAGLYLFQSSAFWSAVAAGQRITQYGSNGSSAALDDFTARALTPAGYQQTAVTALLAVSAAEAPVWATPLTLDGGSGNTCQVNMSAAYWPASDRAVIY